MKFTIKSGLLIAIAFLLVQCKPASVKLQENPLALSVGETETLFSTDFVVIYSASNPTMKTKPAGLDNVSYNIPVWKALDKNDLLKQVERNNEQFGDGFDDNILNATNEALTPNIYHSGNSYSFKAEKAEMKEGKIYLTYPTSEVGTLSVVVDATESYPKLSYEFTPAKAGYFSVGYVGAPATTKSDIEEIWQPLIWHEKRVPDRPYMTLAYRCPIPTTLATTDGVTVGVIADKAEFPFMPLPLAKNSRFGVVLLNNQGTVQPQLFAPVLGGIESKMIEGKPYTFSMHLFAKEMSLSTAFETITKELAEFADYRENVDITLNQTLDNIIDYAMSSYSLFEDSLKGCNYSTDAPGAVKNVSSLNPLQIALLTQRLDIYEQRAYPMVEYGLSREKFLFSIDPKQKIQFPSRQLNGPCVPISELTSLYQITGENNDYLLDLAEKEYYSSRTRNLQKLEVGEKWQNAMALYRATQDEKWLAIAQEGADKYIENRVNKRQEAFDEKGAEFFFWPGFVPDFISLFELYEVTNDDRYLAAAHEGIRRYASFVWFVPQIPQEEVVVNPKGLAPHYAYLRGKGYKQMEAATETVEAWRLSEIGLTPESSSTSTGHRGIFMTNFAPWMMRIGYLTGDTWLQDIARSAVIGRYKNFPGYHINTERTTVYEKEEYPYRKYNELSVNSFHFNHIWPMANMITDYLVTDAFVKSEGEITFPSEFVEGFAYLQSKFYGHKTGSIYNEKDVHLYLPQNMLSTTSCQLNHIAGYNNDNFFIVFTNQSKEKQTSTITLSNSLFANLEKQYDVAIWSNNVKSGNSILNNGTIEVEIDANGIVVLAIAGLQRNGNALELFDNRNETWNTTYAKDGKTGTIAMLLNMGEEQKSVFVYLNGDDAKTRNASLSYSYDNKEWHKEKKPYFPFEFTIDVPSDCNKVWLQTEEYMKNGTVRKSAIMKLIK